MKEIDDFKNHINQLESDLASAQERLLKSRDSWEASKEALITSRNRLTEAHGQVEQALFGIAAGRTSSTKDLKAARTSVVERESEIRDLEAILKAHATVEGRLSEENKEVRNQLEAARKHFWRLVAEELAEETRKAVGDLLRRTLACYELSGWVIRADEWGDRLREIFFQGTGPKLAEDKQQLIEEYIK